MSSLNCHPVSVSINSESRSPEKALHKLTHSASTRKQTAIPAGDDRLPNTRLRLPIQESSGRLITRKTYSLGLATTNFFFSFSYSALLKEEERLVGCVIWRQFVDI